MISLVRICRVECSVGECPKPVLARGWCNAHYRRWQRHGDPLKGSTSPGAAQAWLTDYLANLPDSTDCVEWPYGKGKWGYGVVRWNGKSKPVHIIVNEAVRGPRPAGMETCHSCGNRACVNPAHLRWDTPINNQRDKLKHGTHNRGNKHYGSKLTADDVQEIRRSSDSQAQLAARFGVHPGTIQCVIDGRTWAWLQ